MKPPTLRQLDLQISDSLIKQVNQYPSENSTSTWINKTLEHINSNSLENVEISIRIVDEQESSLYNKQYRQKDKPTNVLSFPAEIPDYVENKLLGDLLICAPVVLQEAQDQNKKNEAHWAHLIIHGTLHLLGYDHIQETEAEKMESLEINILKELGFSNPYEITI